MRDYTTAIPSPMGNATSAMNSAASTTANMMQGRDTVTTAAPKTAGGVLQAGLGGAASGAAISGGNPAGAVIGAGVGVAAYLFS